MCLLCNQNRFVWPKGMGKWVCEVSKKVLGGKGGKTNGLNYWGFQLNGLYCLERCGLKWDVIVLGEFCM